MNSRAVEQITVSGPFYHAIMVWHTYSVQNVPALNATSTLIKMVA